MLTVGLIPTLSLGELARFLIAFCPLLGHRETAEPDARAQSQLKIGARGVPQDVSHLEVLNGSGMKGKNQVLERFADRV